MKGVGGKSANGEWYAAECDGCGLRTRDESKIGERHKWAFCSDGRFAEFDGVGQ